MKLSRVLGAVVAAAGLLAGTVYAKEEIQIMQTITNQKQLEIYAKAPELPETVSVQIGRDSCEDVQIVDLQEDQKKIQTLIFLYNSLSITEGNRGKIKEFLNTYLDEKYQNDEVSLYLFGEEAKPVIEKSADGEEVKQALETVEYTDQNSWLIDAVYDVLKTHENDAVYTRVMIISDGVDEKTIGYTKEEFADLLGSTGVPMYAVGCVYKQNQNALEQFFALSRKTAGAAFLLDDISDENEIAAKLLEDSNISCITATIPEALQDGSEKAVQIKLQGSDGETEVRTQARMPFGEAAEAVNTENTENTVASEPEEAETTAEEPETTEKETVLVEESESEAENQQNTEKVFDPVTVVAILAVIAGICFLMVRKWKNGKDGKKEKAPKTKKEKKAKEKELELKLPEMSVNENAGKNVIPMEKQDSDETCLMEDGGETLFMDGTNAGSWKDEILLLRLQDMDHPERVFQYPVAGNVFIGRTAEANQIVLDYDRSVSGRQCRVYAKGDRIFVENLSNVNITQVNSVKVERDIQIHSSDILKMGHVQMRVQLIRK